MPPVPTCTVTVAGDAAPLKRKNKALPNPAALRKICDFMVPAIAIYRFKKIRVTPESSRNNAVTSLLPNELFKTTDKLGRARDDESADERVLTNAHPGLG
jgi:hypothetical protein